MLRSHINLSWKLILPHPSCFQAGVKSLERLKTCLHCDKHHEARLSALDAAPSNLSSIWKTAPVCWPRQSKAIHFLPACQLLRSYQCHADGKTFRRCALVYQSCNPNPHADTSRPASRLELGRFVYSIQRTVWVKSMHFYKHEDVSFALHAQFSLDRLRSWKVPPRADVDVKMLDFQLYLDRVCRA